MNSQEANEHRHSRRRFVRNMGSIIVGVPLLGATSLSVGYAVKLELPGSLKNNPHLDSWLEILEDNRIRIFTGKVELGQGIGTAIKQVAAEELNTHIDRTEIVHANTEQTPNEGYTAGSGSVKGSAMAVRYAAAAAGHRLCQIAADKIQEDIKNLIIEDGFVRSKTSGRKLSFFQLLDGHRWEVEISEGVLTKERSNYKVSGTSNRRSELRDVFAGKPYFIQDLRFEGQLHARICRPSGYQSHVKKASVGDVRDMLPDTMQLIHDGNFIAILGSDEYQVVKTYQAATKLLKWESESSMPDLSNFKAILPSFSYEEKEVAKSDGVPAESEQVFSGSFYKPYIMHGSIAPACGIAHFEKGKLAVWTNSQGVFPLRAGLASMLQMKESEIVVHSVPGAGCFGHNSADDAAADAALLAIAIPGKHIKVQWSRQQENQWEALGCAMRMDIEAGLTRDGRISFWKSEVWTDSHSTRQNKDPGTLLTARLLEPPARMQGRGYLGGGYRNSEPYYDIEHKDIKAYFYEGPLRVSSLRSLGSYHNAFAIESIIDEMANHLGEHPIDFRIRCLTDHRAIELLLKLKSMTGYIKLESREGIGYSFCRYKSNDAYCAIAAHVAVDKSGNVVIKKVWSTLDVGEVINPDGLINQTQGGITQAASWTIFEEVKTNDSIISSDNWATYPMMRFDGAFHIEVELMPRPDDPPLGGGESSLPPVPAAITNAIYAATKIRIFNLPINAELLKQ